MSLLWGICNASIIICLGSGSGSVCLETNTIIVGGRKEGEKKEGGVEEVRKEVMEGNRKKTF